MSFSQQVKTEIAEQVSGGKGGRAAELAGLLCMCGTVKFSEENTPVIVVFTENEPAEGKYFTLLKKEFRIDDESAVRERVTASRRRGLRVTLAGPKAEAVRRGLLLPEGDISLCGSYPPPQLVASPQQQKAFLRGAFLAAGTVSAPESSYHLEIACGSPELAERICGILRGFSLGARVSHRAGKHAVYVKDGEDVSAVLSLLGAHRALLEMENVRVIKEIRGDINRRVNFEAANIRKAADTGAQQCEDVRYLLRHGGLAGLPDSLREIARLRLEMPDATLAELGEALSPPVGKSGVNHRLRKLTAISQRLRETRGE